MEYASMLGRDFRAELARLGLHHYLVAAQIGIHPVTLSKVLWEKAPMTRRVRDGLKQIIERDSSEHLTAVGDDREPS